MYVKALADELSMRVSDVLLDGKSVKNISFEADDEVGMVMVFPHKYEQDGKLELLEGEPYAMRGKVQIILDPVVSG